MKRSSKNTKGAQQRPNLPVPVNPAQPLAPINQPQPQDAQVAQLQKELEEEREGRDHDRFYSAMAIGALVVVIVFMGGNVAAGSFASIIYVAALILLGKRYGVEGVIEALEQAKRLFPSADDQKD